MQDAAIGIVFDSFKQNQVLWVKRRDIPIWVLPGGGIDPGETAEMAILREVEEEAGVQVKITRQAAHYQPINCVTSNTHLFICHLEKGSPRPTEEASEAAFFPLQTPPKPHFPLHAQWLQEALQNPSFIKRPLTGFKWGKVLLFFLRHPSPCDTLFNPKNRLIAFVCFRMFF